MNRFLFLCWILALVLTPSQKVAVQDVKIAVEDLQRYAGNYKVDVYPQPFGFFVQDGKLYLKVGGLESSGQAVPLIPQGAGKFVISPDHPNAFQFKIKDDRVEFILYSAGNPIPGYRLDEKKKTSASGTTQTSSPPKTEKNRADILTELKTVAPEFKKNSQDNETRFKYGKLLYQSGDFWQAEEVIAPLVKSATLSDEALALAGELEYLLGNYAEAEKVYKRLVDARAGNVTGQVMAKVALVFIYYQTNEFDKVKDLDFPPGVQLPNLELMKAFEATPYQMDWRNQQKVSIVPFLMTDPLPVLTVEFNGVPVQVILDTGADTFILDNEIAAAMGIQWVAKAMGTFGGGLKSEVGFGKVDSVTLSDITLKQVPITILPCKRFSSGFENGKYILGGFLGTSVLRQFLATIDYKNGQLILREKTNENVRKRREELDDRIAAEVPFVLKATHLMMVRGSLNDKGGLTFFVDSGLASDACFAASLQTLQYVGIPAPETRVSEEASGGGGGKWASGLFPIATVGIGSLSQSHVQGEYGSRPPESYWAHGFIEDGLISHGFLRQYSSWTLDFDEMKYIFEK